MNLGSLQSPDLDKLSIFHKASISPHHGKDAVLIAWAKKQSYDGIWFTDQISANLPLTSRGGIFQHRLSSFRSHVIASLDVRGCPDTSWPMCRVPNVVLA
jgi:hypothetical protein